MIEDIKIAFEMLDDVIQEKVEAIRDNSAAGDINDVKKYLEEIEEIKEYQEEINSLKEELITSGLFTDGHLLGCDFKYEKPKRIKIDGKMFEVKTWKSAYTKMLAYIRSVKPEKFNGLKDREKFQGASRTYFSERESDISKPIKIGQIYCETGFSANHGTNIIKSIMENFGLVSDVIRVYLVKD